MYIIHIHTYIYNIVIDNNIITRSWHEHSMKGEYGTCKVHYNYKHILIIEKLKLTVE